MNSSKVFFENEWSRFASYNGDLRKIDLTILQQGDGTLVMFFFCLFVESVMQGGRPAQKMNKKEKRERESGDSCFQLRTSNG